MGYKSSQNQNDKTESWYQRHPELVGIILILLATLVCMSITSFQSGLTYSNTLGLFGYTLSYLCYKTFGIAVFLFAALLSWFGLQLILFPESFCKKKLLAFVLVFASFCMGLTLLENTAPSMAAHFSNFLGAPYHSYRLGGFLSYFFYKEIPYCSLERLFNFTGTCLLSTSIFVISIGYLFEKTFQSTLQSLKETIFQKRVELLERREQKKQERAEKAKLEEDEEPIKYRTSSVQKETSNESKSSKFPSILSHAIELPPSFNNIPESISGKAKSEQTQERVSQRSPQAIERTVSSQKTHALTPPSAPQSTLNYKIPPHDLLNTVKKITNAELKKELKHKADLLEETLGSFGIEAKVGQIYSGPTITCFEVHPAVGVKVGRIRTLEHDIALNLEAKSIRIIAPIPGKAAVGIEVPNKVPQEVGFKELLAAYQNSTTKFRIPLLLGKTVNGDIVMHDLAKMPHCIIAGATGSGKSVCINSIVMSILLTASPDEIRLLMVDPKKVELTPYSNLPHMLAPVITEPKTACIALNWLVKEMEKRYELLKLTGQRNIEAFNQRKIDRELEQTLGIQIPDKLPYYVGIIDELADLMMVSSQDIETPIARIAQMARAVGIHLILATQRPSREVITGLIKANFPTRISFKVASRVNSQIVLDEIGAETLLGNGDMLILPPGSSQLIRAQGVFVRDEEITRTVQYICQQMPPQYIISSFDRLGEDSLSSESSRDDQPGDALFEEAKTTIISTGNASTTYLQRKLKVGYARAASLMDELEKKGIVGPQEGAKPRKIYFPKMSGVQAQGSVLDEDFDA